MTSTLNSARSVPPEQWRKRTTRRFTARTDPRELLVIEHPWAPSTKGGYGEWSTKVSPPDGWKPGDPLYISFYQSDNYCGAVKEHLWTDYERWVGSQAFNGHRFKQLLVNGKVVWESDVADQEMTSEVDHHFNIDPQKETDGWRDPYRVVDISSLAAAGMTLTFRVVDKVPSTVKLPGDFFKRFDNCLHDPTKAEKRFQTTVYWGDVALTTEQPAALTGQRFAALTGQRGYKRGAQVGCSRAAPSARQTTKQRIPSSGIPLRLVLPGKLPAPGYPVRSGVPLPEGTVPAGTTFSLRDPKGRNVPLATRELAYWFDGSVQWLLCEFVATQAGAYRLVPGKKTVKPQTPVVVKSENGVTAVTNGTLSLRIDETNSANVFESVSLKEGLALGPMDFSIKLSRTGWLDQLASAGARVTIESANPVCAVVRVEGDMLLRGEAAPAVAPQAVRNELIETRSDASSRFGPWRVRLHIWAGLPYVIADWRLINESDQATAMLLDWSARVQLPDLDEARVDFGPFVPDCVPVHPMHYVDHEGHYDFTPENMTLKSVTLHAKSSLLCSQELADVGRIYKNGMWVASADRAAGYANVRHPQQGGFLASMRWFAETFPKGIGLRPDLLTLQTAPQYPSNVFWRHDRPFVRIGRGEAWRQAFALWLHDGKVSRTQAERFHACVQDFPHVLNRQWFADSGAIECGPPREAKALKQWDRYVTPSLEANCVGLERRGHREYWDTAWRNDYRGRMHQALNQYVETGRLEWLRYFDAGVTHNRDVDVFYYCPEHPDWVGATHIYALDHTSEGITHSIDMNLDAFLDHYFLTGDPDSLAAAQGMSERFLGCHSWPRGAREIGWPLSQVMRWYAFTRDKRFLDKAEEWLAAVRAYVEPRRGVFSEIHGNYNYLGVVSFMTGLLAFGLVRHHRVTGDPGTLDLLALLAYGLFSESRVGPGRFSYSPNPEIETPAPPQELAGWGGRMFGNRGRYGFNALIGGLAGYLHQVTGEKQYAEWARECFDEVVRQSGPKRGAEEADWLSGEMIQLLGWLLRSVAGGGDETADARR